MPSSVSGNIKERLQVLTPGMPVLTSVCVNCAEVVRFALFVGRKVRLFSHKENIVPFIAGGVLDLVAGESKTIQYIARVVFGAVCILRCAEDLIEIKRLGQRCRRLWRGEEYILVKRDRWEAYSQKGMLAPSTQAKVAWKKQVRSRQLKQFFITIGLIFKKIVQLANHLSDACTAYKKKAVSKAFLYSKRLWDKLTSDQAILVKYLKRVEQTNDWMLSKRGVKVNSKALLVKITLAPARARQVVPDPRDVKKAIQTRWAKFANMIGQIGDMMRKRYLRFLDKSKLIFKLPSGLVPQIDQKCRPFGEGGKQDQMRFMLPPKRVIMRS